MVLRGVTYSFLFKLNSYHVSQEIVVSVEFIYVLYNNTSEFTIESFFIHLMVISLQRPDVNSSESSKSNCSE